MIKVNESPEGLHGIESPTILLRTSCLKKLDMTQDVILNDINHEINTKKESHHSPQSFYL